MAGLITKVVGGKSRKLDATWSTAPVHPLTYESSLAMTTTQKIADEIDKEIIEGTIASFTIFVHPSPLPKKGDLVRYRTDLRRRNPDGTRQPWTELNGLCISAYDHETKTPGEILFEDGEIKNFDLLPEDATHHVSLDIIND